MNALSKLIPDEKLPFRDAIALAEGFILKAPQVELEIVHHFSPGLYAREMRIPAGIVLTGMIHKSEHLCTLSGDIEIMDEEGGGRFTGYHTFLSKPGVKRIGLAHASTVFTTFHVTHETDIDALEAALVVETYAEYEQFLLEKIRDDYQQFLIEYRFAPGHVKILVENETDQIPMPPGFDKLERRPSLIEGEGLFAKVDMSPGELIAPARINKKRTPAGRYTNHSPTPNTYFSPLANGDLDLMALYKINAGDEVTLDYRQAGKVNGYKGSDL